MCDICNYLGLYSNSLLKRCEAQYNVPCLACNSTDANLHRSVLFEALEKEYADHLDPQYTSITGLIVSIRWCLGSLKEQLGCACSFGAL